MRRLAKLHWSRTNQPPTQARYPPMSQTVLIVEDELAIADSIADALRTAR